MKLLFHFFVNAIERFSRARLNRFFNKKMPSFSEAVGLLTVTVMCNAWVIATGTRLSP